MKIKCLQRSIDVFMPNVELKIDVYDVITMVIEAWNTNKGSFFGFIMPNCTKKN